MVMNPEAHRELDIRRAANRMAIGSNVGRLRMLDYLARQADGARALELSEKLDIPRELIKVNLSDLRKLGAVEAGYDNGSTYRYYIGEIGWQIVRASRLIIDEA